MSLPSEVLQAIEPRQAAAWLRANGWEIVDNRPEHTATYRKSAGAEGDYLVDLPLDHTFRDYSRRMGEVLETLQIATGKRAAWILEEVRAATFDIIRLRSTGPGVGQGRVPVELGAQLFGHARELLLAAACSAQSLRPVYRSRKPTEVLDFLRRVQVAAPEEGSFVITLHAPVPPSLQTTFLPSDMEELPFERRSTLMLASATVAARNAAEQAGLDGGVQPFHDAIGLGLSANLCDALAGFANGVETTGLQLQFSWAASRPVPAGTPTMVQFGADLAPVLREGARLLRASGSTPDFELEGAVVRLDSTNPGQGGVAVIAGQVDGQSRKVRVPMDASDYTLAVRAHRDGQLLQCEGELVREGQSFKLDRVRHVALVHDLD